MSTTRAGAASVGTRRPRDRKAQILSVAADQFGNVGYNNASIAAIADAVGITPGALYRHFRNKEAMLIELTFEGSDRFVEALSDDSLDFTTTMTRLVALAVSRRGIGILWQREARNLPRIERVELRRRLHYCHQKVSTVIAARRETLDPESCDLLARAVLTVLLSPSYHRAQVPDDRFTDALEGMVSRIADTRLEPDESAGSPHRDGLSPQHTRRSRRELLLVEAAGLFAEHGFHAVTMDDIGQAAGMTGPSIYNHFVKKDEILLAALNRGADLLDAGLNSALTQAHSAPDALHLALLSYIDVMTNHPALITIVVNETASLADPLRHRLRSRQREYVDEWVHLLGTMNPGVDSEELRAIALAAITTVNILVNSPEVSERSHLVEELSIIGDRIMDIGPHTSA
ncbi:hypothetical protein BJD99_05860 [Rhodococcus sp. 1163]|uniref:TetR/AcrR family transcriptional regulator n=1 Tax=unclassified Rhodococcus (in: high G+C Gram-positive bacteria) TaxID=192944 RepID=UPI000A0D6890|nr:TetR/AcrR family transcriptional regulator [Rhodococcus sp. 1163]ORI15219.1 hypothetical protein BJD99_05860 [Rhodococcus sp. 1163]